jgi:cytochrome P450
MNAAVIHRDKTVFGDDADEFRPERWINCAEEQVKLMNRHLMTVSFLPIPWLAILY